ncbi:antitoxin [Kitasatospora sp. KL5]|uniref:antitoxin n=1 Tax=Kitasatospora sp. KL5 TaxID=3425125 RepID=UPI003D6ECFE7
MGLKDSLKEKAGELKVKASELTGRHEDTIDNAVDKTGEAVDKATKHKYHAKIEHGTAKAKHVINDFATKPGPGKTS